MCWKNLEAKEVTPEKVNVGMERVCSDDARQQIPPFDFDLWLLKPACPFGFKTAQSLAPGLLKSGPTHLTSPACFLSTTLSPAVELAHREPEDRKALGRVL